MSGPDLTDLAAAFDAALRQVELERLRADLHAQRAAALEAGGVDPEWVRRTVRRVVEWTPETELALVAALGAIARASLRAHGA